MAGTRKKTDAAARSAPVKKQGKERPKNAEATRRNILEEAMREFSLSGYSGARVDTIADNTHTSKRMLYYYFESKEGLWLEVLKESYRNIRDLELAFHLEDLPPMLALRKLVELTFDHHAAHPDFIRIIMTENIHQGRHIKDMKELKDLNRPIIDLLTDLCKRGVEEGVFRKDIDPIDLHSHISALSFFNVSNKYTFGFLFDRDFSDKKVHTTRRDDIVDMISRYARSP